MSSRAALLKTENKRNTISAPTSNKNTEVVQQAFEGNSYGLHHSFGNIKVYGTQNRPGTSISIQPKLTINQPGDKYEQEAEHLSDRILKTSTLHAQYDKLNLVNNTSSFQNNYLKNKNLYEGNGQPLPPPLREFFEPRFGYDLSDIRLHTDEKAAQKAKSIDALAFTAGNDIFFGQESYAPQTIDGRRLLAHELAHVVSPSHMGVMRRVAPNYSQISSNLSYGVFDWAITDREAHDVLLILSGLNDTDLNDTLERMRSDGYFTRLRDNLPSADLPTFDAMVERVRLQQIQRTGARTFATGQGMASQAEMAQRQSSFMVAQNTAAATAVHGPAPTAAQVSAQQSSTVASTSIAPQAAVLSPADEARQNADTTAAVATFITWVTTNHPTLHITAAQLRVDSRAVFDRGQNVVAFGEPGRAVVGNPFALAVAANPAYALAVIVHELRGHPNYGAYSQTGTEFGLELYDQAAALMPGYTQPTGAGRRSEIDAYGYQETEIYSLMVSLPYYTPVSAAHSALSSVNFDPTPAISARIGLIKTQFEPSVAQSLLRGLVLRFRADTQLQPMSVAAFEQGIRNNFTPAEATAILH